MGSSAIDSPAYGTTVLPRRGADGHGLAVPARGRRATRLLVDCGMFQGEKALRLRNWAEPGFDPAHGLGAGPHPHAPRPHRPRAAARQAGLLRDDLLHAADARAGRGPAPGRRAPAGGRRGVPQPQGLHEARAGAAALRPGGRRAGARSLRGGPARRGARGRPRVRASRTARPGTSSAPPRSTCTVRENGSSPSRVLFSGDVGRYDAVLAKDPAPAPEADYVVVESTYGNRTHPDVPVLDQLEGVLKRTFARGRRPARSRRSRSGRAQQMIWLMDELVTQGRIRPFPIHVDSPMAIDATRIYAAHPEASRVSLNNIGGRSLLHGKWVAAPPHARRVAGPQRDEGAGGHHLVERHALGRTHPAPLPRAPAAPREHAAHHRLPGRGYARARAARRRPRGAHPQGRRAGARRGARPQGPLRATPTPAS